MRIHLMSDLHVEFGALDKPLPTGDVLILGGDITLLGAFDPECDLYHQHPHIRDSTDALLAEVRSTFERIFYLIGNHEPYHYDLTKAPKIIKQAMKGVTLLENKAVDLGDNVILVGGTLWTDMDKGRAAWHVGSRMNDFRVVHVEEGGSHRRFTPQDAMAKFAKTKRFIEKTAKANPDKTIVVATHHAPSIHGINRDHVEDSMANHGYYTDLHAFIEENPNIRYWTHGHTHIQATYPIGKCTVISNARGYYRQEDSARTFNPNCWFDPVSGEVHFPYRARAMA